MILVDTSIWIEHLRSGNDDLAVLLNDGQVVVHPFVFGEMALGKLSNRAEILSNLQNLPMIPIAATEEVLFFIEQRQLGGRGIGYVDAHLLTATALIPATRLWTRDKKLSAVAVSLELVYEAN